jgi:hypothetical protein
VSRDGGEERHKVGGNEGEWGSGGAVREMIERFFSQMEREKLVRRRVTHQKVNMLRSTILTRRQPSIRAFETRERGKSGKVQKLGKSEYN